VEDNGEESKTTNISKSHPCIVSVLEEEMGHSESSKNGGYSVVSSSEVGAVVHQFLVPDINLSVFMSIEDFLFEDNPSISIRSNKGGSRSHTSKVVSIGILFGPDEEVVSVGFLSSGGNLALNEGISSEEVSPNIVGCDTICQNRETLVGGGRRGSSERRARLRLNHILVVEADFAREDLTL